MGAKTGAESWQSHWIDNFSISYSGGCLAIPNFGSSTPKDHLYVKELEEVKLEATLFTCTNQPIEYQWYFIPEGATESVAIPGAQDLTYKFKAGLDDFGQYYLVGSTLFFEIRSRNATVREDKGLGPGLLNVISNTGNNSILIIFDKRVDPVSALNRSHYIIEGLSIINAKTMDHQTVRLLTSPQNEGQEYEILVQEVTDLAASPNYSNFRSTFISQELTPEITSIKTSDNRIIIDFVGILQSSESIIGRWRTVKSFSGTYRIDMADEKIFFRLRP